MVIRTIIQSMLLVVLLATTSVAENYRVPNAMMDQVSGVLGEDMIATQSNPWHVQIHHRISPKLPNLPFQNGLRRKHHE